MAAPAARGTFQCKIISDLHLEFYKDPTHVIESVAQHPAHISCLFLAGDIGYPSHSSFVRAFKAWSAAYAHVFYIIGNHELYDCESQAHPDRTIVDVLTDIRALCATLPNVHFLHDSVYDLPVEVGSFRLRIIGSPLWYHTPDVKRHLVMQNLNDYRCIRVPIENGDTGRKTRKIVPTDVNEWHNTHKCFLDAAIAEALLDGVPCIVMTHHLPSFALIHPRYIQNELNFSFASSLGSIVAQPHVALVMCGHSHSYRRVTLDHSTPAVLNAAGYPHEGGVDEALSDEHCLVSIPLPDVKASADTTLMHASVE
jgi:predicted phosphodiesterase